MNNMHLFVYFVLMANADARARVPTLKKSYTSNLHIKDLVFDSRDIFLIDADNVRGKSGFSFTKESFCESFSRWANHMGIIRRAIVYFDHGEEENGFLAPNGLAIVFSGPICSADDVISRDVFYFHEELDCDVVLVTDDQELKGRCKKSKRRSINFFSSVRMAELLLALQKNASIPGVESTNWRMENSSVSEEEVVRLNQQINNLQVELRLKQKISMLRRQLKNGVSRLKQKKIKSRLPYLEDQLASYTGKFSHLMSPMNATH